MEQQEKKRPKAIQLALETLQGLSKDADHDAWKKLLPGFAMALHRTGETVTEELLQDYMSQGIDAVSSQFKILQSHYKKNQNQDDRTYANIAAGIRKKPEVKIPEPETVLRAARTGDLAFIQHYLEEHGSFKHGVFPESTIVDNAAKHGQIHILEFLYEQGCSLNTYYGQSMRDAAEKGLLDVVAFFVEHGVDFRIYDHDAMHRAAKNGHTQVVKYLYESGSTVEQYGTELMREIEHMGHYNTARFLYDQGICTDVKDKTLSVFQKMDAWHAIHGAFPADGLEDENPYMFQSQAFETAQEAFHSEGYKSSIGNLYAFHISSLFGTSKRILDYLEKWGDNSHQPLHNAGQDIKLPQNHNANLAAWGDALLRHGPKMARLVQFADKLPEPLKDPKGGWAYIKTKEEVAKHAYARGQEFPELANLSMDYSWREEYFEDAIEQIKKYQKKYGDKGGVKPEGSIPNISIDGLDFDKHGYRFYKLPDGDIRGLFLGEMTNCCQHLAGAGEDCAKHGFTSKHGGFYVVENKDTGKIIGQSWAWRGKKGELVWDSLESLGQHFNEESWTKLCHKFADALEQNTTDITSFHVGMDGATPSLPFPEAKKAAKPKKYNGYRDSDDQYQIWMKAQTLVT